MQCVNIVRKAIDPINYRKYKIITQLLHNPAAVERQYEALLSMHMFKPCLCHWMSSLKKKKSIFRNLRHLKTLDVCSADQSLPCTEHTHTRKFRVSSHCRTKCVSTDQKSSFQDAEYSLLKGGRWLSFLLKWLGHFFLPKVLKNTTLTCPYLLLSCLNHSRRDCFWKRFRCK